jgi:hypothetical protein
LLQLDFLPVGHGTRMTIDDTRARRSRIAGLVHYSDTLTQNRMCGAFTARRAIWLNRPSVVASSHDQHLIGLRPI